MASRSEQFNALIQEMDQIEDFAESFQSGSAKDGSKASPEDVTRLREWYLDWYMRCRALLSDAGKKSFSQHYSTPGYNIHNFISDPTGTWYGRRQPSTSSYYHWRHEYKRNFQEPFNEQRLCLMRFAAAAKVLEASPPPPPPPAIDTIRLHSRVRAVSSKLFKDGHYRQAIVQACLALNEAVQQRSGRSDIDGAKLMQEVFSAKDPTLKFDGHADEQLGYMWLFSGMWMAVRNPRSHQVGETEDLDANEALELLALVSALFRALDRARKM